MTLGRSADFTYDASGRISGIKGKIVVNVKDAPYGARGDGTTDDTSAIQRAITAASAANMQTFIPGGHYKLTSTLTIPSSAIIRGAGRNPVNGTPTRLNFSTLTGTTLGISIVSGSNIVMSDFYLTGRSSGSGDEIAVTGGNRGITLERITVNTSTTGNGIGLGAAGGASHYVISSVVKNVTVVGATTGFFIGNSSTSTSFESCYANVCVNYGYMIQGTYLSFNACAADANGLYGYVVQNAVGVAFAGCGAENSGRTAWHLTGAKHVVLSGCRGVNGNTTAHVSAPSFMAINDASDYVTLIGCIDTTPNAATTNSVKNWSGTAPTSVTLTNCDMTAKGVNANVPTLSWSAVTGTTAPAAGGAGALPATPLGYATVNINGTARKIAYY